MRKAPIGPIPNYFVYYLLNDKDYYEVFFERECDAIRYYKKLKKLNIEARLATNMRAYPEA